MGRVKIGNVRTPIDYLKQIFAPAGYGWGEGSPAAQFNENNVNRTSVFVAASEDMPTSDSIWLCEFYATSSDGSGDYGHMVATSQGGVAKGCCCLRLKENGVYSEWDWDNPPMVLGVEYRTTERWADRPVYTMLIDCGSTKEGTTQKAVPFTGTPIRSTASAGGLVSPYRPNDSDIYRFEVHVDGSNITLTVGSGEVGKPAYVQVWYVK